LHRSMAWSIGTPPGGGRDTPSALFNTVARQ
jgi:hypothetical protein